MPTFEPASPQHFATIACRHTGAKTVLAQALYSLGLIGPFHGDGLYPFPSAWDDFEEIPAVSA